MFRILPVAIVTLLALGVTLETQGQTQFHQDGKGYSIRAGNTIFNYRSDGSSSTYIRSGNTGFYSSNNGTTGTSIYSNSGRFDSYQNASEGWSGSGYTPYSVPQASTYRRTYSYSRNMNPASAYQRRIPTYTSPPAYYPQQNSNPLNFNIPRQAWGR